MVLLYVLSFFKYLLWDTMKKHFQLLFSIPLFCIYQSIVFITCIMDHMVSRSVDIILYTWSFCCLSLHLSKFYIFFRWIYLNSIHYFFIIKICRLNNFHLNVFSLIGCFFHKNAYILCFIWFQFVFFLLCLFFHD